MEQEGRMDQKENLSPYRREFAIQKKLEILPTLTTKRKKKWRKKEHGQKKLMKTPEETFLDVSLHCKRHELEREYIRECDKKIYAEEN